MILHREKATARTWVTVLLLAVALTTVASPARAQTRNVEVVVIADHALFLTYGAATADRANQLFAGAAAIFHDDPDLRLVIERTGTIVFDGGDPYTVTPVGGEVDPSELLAAFSAWADPASGHIPYAYDAAVLLTALDPTGSVVSLAFTGTMCTHQSSGFIQVVGSDAFDSASIARVLGRNLGMCADPPASRAAWCADLSSIPDPLTACAGFVMDGAINLLSPPTAFSPCSTLDFIEWESSGGDTSCLESLVQTRDQQRCVNLLQKNAEKAVKAKSKEIESCIKLYSRGDGAPDPNDIGGCFDADSRNKLQKLFAKAVAGELKKCPAELPGFAVPRITYLAPPEDDPDLFEDGVHEIFTETVHPEAERAASTLIEDLLDDADAAVVVPAPGDRAEAALARCQQKVIKGMNKCFQVRLKEYGKCKKAALASFLPAITDAAELEAVCLEVSGLPGQPDSKGKLIKTCAGNADPARPKGLLKLLNTCVGDGASLTTLFPGLERFSVGCASSSASDLATCIDARTRCALCVHLDRSDDLAVDCDLFDDGAANASCASP